MDVDTDLRRSFTEYLKGLYRKHSRTRAFRGTTVEELVRWQEEMRPRLLELLGGQCETIPDPQLKRRWVEERDGVLIERLLYQTRPGLWTPAFLVRPKEIEGPLPGVLCPPGHGGGMHQVVFEEVNTIGGTEMYKQYPLEIARRGMAALVPEHIGFGERVAGEKDTNHPFYYQVLDLLGESAIGFFLWDLQRALDVLMELPEVDRNRIGCYGLSLGGEMTLFAAAVEPRIRAACISGFFSSYASTFLAERHCGCGYVHGLVQEMEHIDIATLIVPRPLVVESGTWDPMVPVEAALKSVAQLRRIYALCGAKDRLLHDVFVGRHEISGGIAFNALERWLKE